MLNDWLRENEHTTAMFVQDEKLTPCRVECGRIKLIVHINLPNIQMLFSLLWTPIMHAANQQHIRPCMHMHRYFSFNERRCEHSTVRMRRSYLPLMVLRCPMRKMESFWLNMQLFFLVRQWNHLRKWAYDSDRLRSTNQTQSTHTQHTLLDAIISDLCYESTK